MDASPPATTTPTWEQKQLKSKPSLSAPKPGTRALSTPFGGYWTNFEYDWSRSQNQENAGHAGPGIVILVLPRFSDNPLYRRQLIMVSVSTYCMGQ
jgi:hypothetical protein